MKFKEISVFDINQNFFSAFLNSALLCAGTQDNCNMMTVAWGGIGVLWNKKVATIYVRPQRFTLDFVERTNAFTLNFLDHKKYQAALNFCGSKSGKDYNKFKETGLTAYTTKDSNIGIYESDLILECKNVYSDTLKEDNFIDKTFIGKLYPEKDYHKFFIGEIISVFQSNTL